MENNDDLYYLDPCEKESAKGHLIKLLEEKLRKPQLDDSLSQILDEFYGLHKLDCQKMAQGMFEINFSADGLILQGCGQLYAKRVDLLWDALMQAHKRILQSDGNKSANSDEREAHDKEVGRLEERMNRGKRKKISLANKEADSGPSGDKVRLFSEDEADLLNLLGDQFLVREGQECPLRFEKPAPAFEPDNDLIHAWQELRNTDIVEKSRTEGSVLVAQYQKLKCNFRNNTTPTFNVSIYDLTDPDEFNTREGKLISYHHIKQLFDDNDNCLLPDENSTIAKLRLAYGVKQKWLIENHISEKADAETYKRAWENYERQFFAREKRKIQNMPQGSKEDIKKLYDAMKKKEQLARQKVENLRSQGEKDLPTISFDTVIVDPVKEGYEGIFDPYIPEGYECGNTVISISDELTPSMGPSLPLDGDHEAELSRLLEGLSKTPDPTASHSDNVRSDSGYFDGGFEDGESDHDEDTPSATPIVGNETPYEFDKRCDAMTTEETQESVTTNDNENQTEVEQPQQHVVPLISETNETPLPTDLPIPESVGQSTDEEIVPEPNDISPENDIPTSESPLPQTQVLGTDVDVVAEENERQSQSSQSKQDESDKKKMQEAILEFCKLGSESKQAFKALKDSHFEKNTSYTCVVYNKGRQQKSAGEVRLKTGQVAVIGKFKLTNEKRNEVKLDVEEPLAKRRKLPPKQVAKLLQGRVAPVSVKKWETFFSLNYNAELGEGEMVRDHYESDEDLFDDDDEIRDNEETNNNDLDVSGYQESDHAELLMSTQIPATQDSGIGDDENLDDSNAEPMESSQSQKHSGASDLGLVSIPELSENIDTIEIAASSSTIQQTFDFADMSPIEQEREEIKKRVEEWRAYMRPILKKLDGSDFSIEEYGSDIINSMDINEEKLFDDIVAGKPPSEVVRYFVSSLELANRLNVEVSGVKKAQLSNGSLRLKLLSKERRQQQLEKYQAPSEKAKISRLEKAEGARMHGAVRKSSNKRTDEYEQAPKRQRIYNDRKQPKIPDSIVATPSFGVMDDVHTPPFGVEEDVSRIQTSPRVDFQQPCSSWQADLIDQQKVSESPNVEANKTPSRISIDSGFMPCDEDLFENFDPVNQGSNFATSTPLKLRRLMRVTITKKTFFSNN